jgi:hypothetical protein
VLKTVREFPELEPQTVAIFGGVIDPGELRWPFNRMKPSDARDWSAIRAWATELADSPRFGGLARERDELASAVPTEYR